MMKSSDIHEKHFCKHFLNCDFSILFALEIFNVYPFSFVLYLESLPDRMVDPPHKDGEQRIMAPKNFPFWVFHLQQQQHDQL